MQQNILVLFSWLLGMPCCLLLAQDQPTVQTDAIPSLESDDDRSLIRFNASRAGLNDADAKRLESMHNLKNLILSKTNITDEGFQYCKNLTGLRTLDLSNTNITDAGLVHLRNLTQLTTLTLPPQATNQCLDNLRSMTGIKRLRISADKTDPNPNRVSLSAIVELFESQGRTIREALVATKTSHRLDDEGYVKSLNASGSPYRPRLTNNIIDLCNRFEHLESLSLDAHIQGSVITDTAISRLRTDSKLSNIVLSGITGSSDGLSHLGSIKSLTSVQLDAQVTDDTLKHLAELPNLQSLTVSGPDVSNEGLKHLKRLPNLTSLKIRQSSISDEGAAIIGNLASLRELQLTDHQLTGKGLSHLGNLRGLKSLYIYGDQINDSDLLYLTELKELIQFSTWGTKITSLGRLRFFRDVQKRNVFDILQLEHARLRLNADGHVIRVSFDRFDGREGITDEHLALVSRLEHLEEIEIYYHDISASGLKHLKDMVSLQRFSLTGCKKIGDDAIEHLKGLTGLESITLIRLNVGDDAIEHLEHLTALKSITLIDINISDVGIKHLANLEAPEIITITNTSVTPEGLEWLQNKYPDCNVRAWRKMP